MLTDVVEQLLGRPVVVAGVNYYTRCPLPTHPNDHNPSFSIHLTKGLWMCWGCGEKGGIEKLARLLEEEIDEDDIHVKQAMDAFQNSPYAEAKDFADLARSYELDPTQRGLPATVVEYLASRGISWEAAYHFRLGWDSVGHRIAQPYWDDEKCVALKYRYRDGRKGAETGSKRAILGVDDVRGARIVFVTEGESDTYSLWSHLRHHGVPDDVAVGGIPGAAVSQSQWELWALEMLWAERIYIALDADHAGDPGAATALGVLGDKAVRVRPPDGYDIAKYLLEGGSLGKLGVEKDDLVAAMVAEAGD